MPINEQLIVGAGANSTHTLTGDSVCVTVYAIADDIEELNEVFAIEWRPLEPGVTIQNSLVTVLIYDADVDQEIGIVHAVLFCNM